MAYPQFKDETYQLFGGINSKTSEYLNEITEFRDLSNLHFTVPGALSKRPGSASYLGATVSGRVHSVYQFNRLNGASYLVAGANTNLYNVTSTFSPVVTGLQSGALMDFSTFVDRLFVANGTNFFKYDGSNGYLFSLPPGSTASWSASVIIGGGSLATGTYVFAYGYVNERGYYGPPSNGITLSVVGSSLCGVQYFGLTQPVGNYGATAIALYRTSVGGIELANTTLTAITTTTVTDPNWPLTSRTEPTSLFFTLAPKFIEIYNNQLFMGGFSLIPSTVYWSEIGEPEDVEPEYFAEFRTNDGDRITGLKSYLGSLIVTKQNSCHRVTGDNPSNLVLQEITDQYGCLSNRSMVTFNDYLWWLDRQGIVEYNGANIGIISNKVQPIFDNMNITAAMDNAVAIHNKKFNEVWFAIPTSGATLLNTVVVYDYLTKAWTKYEGLNISSLAVAQGSISEQTPFFGNYTGSINYFGASFYNDNGAAITCMIKTRWHANRGQTTENMYRRFYLNLDPIIGFTQAINLEFRLNYDDTTISATNTMYQTPYQSRIDFGLSSRSIQAAAYHTSASTPIRVDGYTFTSRFQRDS